MADYSALWTSSSDPEFQQLKTVKVETERKLAVRLSEVEKEHRLRIKKIQQEIRHNQGTLIKLQAEKEKRVRHLLAVFIKQRRWEAAALYNRDTPTKVTWSSGSEYIKNKSNIRRITENANKRKKQRSLEDEKFRNKFNTKISQVDTDVNNRETLKCRSRNKLLNRDDTKRRLIKITSCPISNEITDDLYQEQRKSINKYSKKTVCFKSINHAVNESELPSGNDSLPSCDKSILNRLPVRDKTVSFQLLKIPKIRTLTLFQLNSNFGHKSYKINVTKTLKEVEESQSKVMMSMTFPLVYHSSGEKHCSRASCFHY